MGGEYEPDWSVMAVSLTRLCLCFISRKPTSGPLAPGAQQDGPPPPPPGPDEPPPPAKPAWRNVQQRPSRKRKGPKEPEPALVEPQEPPRAPSWSTWQRGCPFLTAR